MTRGGDRPGAGRKPNPQMAVLCLGGEIDGALRWLAEHRRLREQSRSGWMRAVSVACDLAEAEARQRLGLGNEILAPQSAGLRAVAEARQRAWDAAVLTAPRKRYSRPRARMHDKQMTEWIIRRIARRHKVSLPTARRALTKWRKFRRSELSSRPHPNV